MYLRFIILLLCFAITCSSYAQKTTTKKASKPAVITKTFDSKQQLIKDSLFLKSITRHYGGKIEDISDSLFNSSSSLKEGEFVSSQYKISFPIKPLGFTSDYEHILAKEQIAELDSMINSFEKETSIEIAVLTLDSSWIPNGKFDSTITAIANHWGVGKKNKNNGVMIGLSRGLRKIRIANGYGIEKTLTDSETKKIIDEIIVPEFKQADYFEGIKKGLQALMQKLR